MTSQYTLVVEALTARFGPGKRIGKELRFRCPVHEATGEHTPSLDVAEGAGGKALLRCRSQNCAASSILKALDIQTTNERANGKRKIVATYDYRDEAGKLLYQVVRFSPKDFSQRRPDGNGGFIWNLRNIRRVPYRLPELLAASAGATVYIVEGEKDVERLAALGLIATTCPQGAGNWSQLDPPTVARAFGGKRCVILRDNDDPGREHGQDVGRHLNGIATEFRTLDLPGLPPKGDVSDWLDAGGTAEELRRLAEAAPLWNDNGTRTNARATAPKADKEQADARQCGVAIILDHFRQRYRAAFRRGNSIHSADGRDVPMNEACAVPDSELIRRLETAVDAPATNGNVVRDKLPGFFNRWVRVAWGDLIRSLPEEDAVELTDDAPAPEEFRRLMREAMLTLITLGSTIGKDHEQERTERRSVISWCQRFAKPGPWRSIRSYKVWSKLIEMNGGEVELAVAIRHELFSQIKADARLREIGPATFSRRSTRYGIAAKTADNRVHGDRAVVLARDFIDDLIAEVVDEPAQSEPDEPVLRPPVDLDPLRR